MNATIKIYSKAKQTKTVQPFDGKKPKLPRTDSPTKLNQKQGEKVTSIVERTNETLTYKVNPRLDKGKQLSAIVSFISQAIGARYKAVIAAGKKLPAKLYFEVSFDGTIYRSETALVKANFQNLVTVSIAKLIKMNDVEAIIGTVAKIQKTALTVSANYLKDIQTIAANVDKETFEDSETFEGMEVSSKGELLPA